jgi:hypothetical protein
VLPIETLARGSIARARLLDESQHGVFVERLGVTAEQHRQDVEQ